ncbi:MAG: Undecaprenyl-phosphate mannosyltransferase [Candidatus Eremiobacteraeota bacterium]|nr:Undecaprenyl-phosphate mannosyltransferase [Candidatus Eremiobacteraeota bacterium]
MSLDQRAVAVPDGSPAVMMRSNHDREAQVRSCAVIPAYNAADSVCAVVAQALEFVSFVIVVDDCCPRACGDHVLRAFAGDERVTVIKRSVNGGVGAAMKTGLTAALEAGADVIIKLDADDQMDVTFVPVMLALFAQHSDVVLIKGNRFVNSSILSNMPRLRLLGNAALSLMAKFATGYWNLLDPTNGYIAFRADFLTKDDIERFSNSYFFEISVLCDFGLHQAQIAEIEMPARYGPHPSSLSIRRVLFEFPPKMLLAFVRRLTLQYFLFDFNLCTLFMVFAFLLISFGVGLAAVEYVQSLVSQIPRTTGTVMLAVLPLMIGLQLAVSALMYDVQSSRIILREAGARSRSRRARILTHI